MRTPRATFVFSLVHSYREMLPLVEHLVGRGWQVDVVVGWRGPSSSAAVEDLRQRGVPVHLAQERYAYVEIEAEESAPRSGIEGRVREPGAVRRALSAARAVPGMLRLRRYARRLVDGLDPDVVFAEMFHSVGRLDNAIARAVRRRGAVSCCVPMSPYAGERMILEARRQNLLAGMVGPSLWVDHDVFNGVVARLFPGWTRPLGNRRFFMFDPVLLLSARAAGLGGRDPWQKPAPTFDIVFLESDFARDQLDPATYPHTALEVVGKPALDRVDRRLDDPAHVEQLFGDVGLAVGEPFVLWNVEPSAEHQYATWDVHWSNIRSVMDALADRGLPVVASLHPLCQPADYAFIDETPGFRVCLDHRIHDLYPYCAISVSFPCSTNTLAPLYGRPLVIYDFFGMTAEENPRGELFRIPGARVARTRDELAAELAAEAAAIRDDAPPLHRRTIPACEAIEHCVLRALGHGVDDGVEVVAR